MPNLLRYWKDYLWSKAAARRDQALFEQVEAFCFFIGHGRSGHTLHGSVMNAHPEMVLAHELDAISYLQRGISRDQLYALILKKDRWFVENGCKWHGFDYKVENQWQGRFQRLRVIGDRKAGVTTLRLKESPQLLSKLREVVRVPLRVIHVVRNPFDTISSLTRQNGRTIEENVPLSLNITRGNAWLMTQLAPSEVTLLRHEDFVAHPKEELRRLIEFVGLKADDPYLSDCAKVVFESPSKSRLKFKWTAGLIKTVEDEIAKHSFLSGYSYQSGLSEPAPVAS